MGRWISKTWQCTTTYSLLFFGYGGGSQLVLRFLSLHKVKGVFCFLSSSVVSCSCFSVLWRCCRYCFPGPLPVVRSEVLWYINPILLCVFLVTTRSGRRNAFYQRIRRRVKQCVLRPTLADCLVPSHLTACIPVSLPVVSIHSSFSRNFYWVGPRVCLAQWVNPVLWTPFLSMTIVSGRTSTVFYGRFVWSCSSIWLEFTMKLPVGSLPVKGGIYKKPKMLHIKADPSSTVALMFYISNLISSRSRVYIRL